MRVLESLVDLDEAVRRSHARPIVILVWHASHFHVTREEIASALAPIASTQGDATTQVRRR